MEEEGEGMGEVGEGIRGRRQLSGILRDRVGKR